MNKKEIASQPRTHSLLESVVNVFVGLGVSVLTQVVVFPFFGIYIPLSSNLKIAAIFTIVSIVRSYVLRRSFNWWHVARVA